MEINASPAFFKELYQFEEVYQLADVDTFVVWVLIDYPQQTRIPETTLAFLHKILGAIQLKAQDFRIADVSAGKVWENYSLPALVPYRQVWGFGNALKTVFPTLNLTAYTPQTIEGILYLQAENLETIQTDVQHKNSLWQALQKTK